MSLPDLCSHCKARSYCRRPCPPIESLADGNKPLKEALVALDMERYPNRDYKAVLSEHQEARALAIKKTISDIRTISDPRRRLIAAALHAELSIEQITIILQITRQHIYKVARREIRQYRRQ